MTALAGVGTDGDRDELLRLRAAFDAVPVACLLLDTDLVVVAANQAYRELLGRDQADLVGRNPLEVFPAPPDGASSTTTAEEGLRRVLRTGEVAQLPLMRYDIETEAGSGTWTTRWWSVLNVPVEVRGRVVGVVHRAEDVTAAVHAREQLDHDRTVAELLRRRTAELEADVAAGADAVTAAVAAEDVATRRLALLAETALALAAADDLDAVVEALAARLQQALGVDGVAVGVRHDRRAVLEVHLSAAARARIGDVAPELPLDSPVPLCVAAREGRAVHLADRAALAGLGLGPEEVAAAGHEAASAVPLRSGGRLVGVLSVAGVEERAADPDVADLLEAVAAQAAQTVDRVRRREAERARAEAVRGIALELHAQLLTTPPDLPGVEVVAEYLPARREAMVGGDWHDVFVVGGRPTFVVGDVAGHDRQAAGSMAQLRNLLRGVAHAGHRRPAAALAALDRAVADLGVDGLATVVVAQVGDGPDGHQVLRWSSAGHLPPVLARPDGTATLLDRPSDLLLGLDPGTGRHEHEVALPVGSLLVLCTDGLVERRDEPLDVSLERLRAQVAAVGDRPLPEVRDVLLRSARDGADDDVALLLVRAVDAPVVS